MSKATTEVDGSDAELPTLEDQINVIGIGSFHYSLIGIVTLLCLADGMEMLVISLLSTTLSKEWGISTIEMSGLASSVFLGVFFGSLAGGYIGDKYGRRTTVLFGGTLFIIGGAASALATSLWMLCIFRSVLGLGFGLFLPAAVCNFSELLPTESRSLYQMLLTGVFWAVGEILVCILAIVLHKYLQVPGWWRAVLFLCLLPGLIGVIMAYIYLPESPHYLSVQGRHEEVEALIRRMAEENGRADALLCGGRVRRIASEPDPDWSWLQLFSKDLLFLTLAVAALWCTGSFAYYGLTFAYPLVLEQRYQMDFEDQYWAVLLAAAAEIPGIFLAIYGASREELGRRWSMAIFLAASAAAAVLAPLIADPGGFLAANMMVKMAISGAFCILFLFAVEVFPTTHRASGVALTSAAARLAGVSAPLLFALTLTASVDLTYQLLAGVLLAGAAVAALMPFDTLHKQLPAFARDAAANAAAADPERRPLLAASGAPANRPIEC